MTTPDHLPQLLALADEGATVEQIRTRTGLAPGAIYSALREHRPDRPRSPRRRTSPLPAKVLGLRAAGVRDVRRIAFLLGLSRQYVHRILKESAL